MASLDRITVWAKWLKPLQKAYDRYRARAGCSALALHTLHCRIPYELVNLQAEAAGDIVGQHPLGQFAGINQAMRSIATSGRFIAERRRVNYRADAGT